MSDETNKIKSDAFLLVTRILIECKTPDPLGQIIRVMGRACAKCNEINSGDYIYDIPVIPYKESNNDQ